jgi:D-3-phosphoglycerate dehydrogenase / 2-oxoglutarate reductase
MTRRYRIVATFDQYDVSWEQEHAAALTDLDVEISQGVPLTTEEFVQVANGADAIMIDAREPITDALLDQLPNLKAIGRHSVGLDGIDLDAATRHNVVVTHYPMYCTAEVADHAIAMIYALNRRIARFDRDLRDGLWVRERYFMDKLLSGGRIRALRNQTLGLIGFGRIGNEVARRMRASVCEVIATDPYVDPETAADRGVRLADQATFFAEADIISIHCPLTPETRGMINRAAIERMKPGVLLINTARGPIVNLADLNDALESGHVAGAALDVFDPEPYPLESVLAAQPNLIMTPHAAYYSEESVEIRRRETLVSVLDVLAGREPVVVANPAVLPNLALEPRSP